jgi:isoquinoline 1-oxidoreductase
MSVRRVRRRAQLFSPPETSRRVSYHPVVSPRDRAQKVSTKSALASGEVSLVVNGRDCSVRADSTLLGALRGELGLTGAKPGCGEGECGACTVLVDGEAVRSCRQPISVLVGRQVTTVEGLARDGTLHTVQQAFAELGAAQCGYCTPGMIVATTALLAHEAHPNDEAINAALAGNICRCGAYTQIRRAVHRAAELATNPGAHAPMPDRPARDRRQFAEPGADQWRPLQPWDLTSAGERDWFGLLGDGLVVVLSPPPPDSSSWSTGGGAWLHVAPDGSVTAFTGKVDVGQDNCTALRLLVAEELGVDLARVRLVMGDTDLCPYDMGTFGSRSMPDAGEALRSAAAAARAMPPVAAGEQRLESVAAGPMTRSPREWRVAGRPRVPEGIIDIVTGRRRYISDLDLPGLSHGAVLHPPVFGATLRTLDASSLAGSDAMVVRTREVTGVVASDLVAARRALEELRAEWDRPAATSDGDIERYLRSHPSAETSGWDRPLRQETGTPDEVLASAAVRQSATYTTAYLAPAALETHAAMARWDDDGRVTIWVGTQTPFATRAQVAAALDLQEERVRVVVPATGGGFGGKHGAVVALEAAVLAREAGAPVKVAWSRHEEFVVGTLRPAAVIDVESAASRDGELCAWIFTDINAGSAALATPYRVAHQRLEYRPAVSPLSQASYRALAATANNFARESQMDELAAVLGLDPVEFRRRNLDDDRLVSVLDAAAERIGWRERRSDVGRGIALGLEKGGRVATAAEVEDTGDGGFRVTRLVTAYECGAMVNPFTVRSQVEGATVMALGGALFEAVRFVEGEITNGSFGSYRVPRLPDVPPIDVVLLDRSDMPSAGAGETPMIAVAPAIANAVFDLTGHRHRSLPLWRADGDRPARDEES